MTVNRYATAAGKKFQRDVMKYLRDERKLDAENLVLTGAEDEGDVILRYTPYARAGDGPDGVNRTVIECKREKGFKLASWVQQAELESMNYAKHRYLRAEEVGFVVVHKRMGFGDMEDQYLTTTVGEWLRSQGL